MSFGGLFDCCSKSSYANRDFGWQLLSPEESLRRSVLKFWTIDREYTCHYGGKCLILKCNCCNQIVRTQRQRLQNRARVGGEEVHGRAPKHYARALRCNMAGPFQICFLRAWTAAAFRKNGSFAEHILRKISGALRWRGTEQLASSVVTGDDSA